MGIEFSANLSNAQLQESLISKMKSRMPQSPHWAVEISTPVYNNNGEFRGVPDLYKRVLEELDPMLQASNIKKVVARVFPTESGDEGGYDDWNEITVRHSVKLG